MSRYQVICVNIGTVYDGDDMIEANRTYGEYKIQSQADYGRASGENVVLLDNGDIKYEHLGNQGKPGETMKDHIVYTTHHGNGDPHPLKWVRFGGLKEGELFFLSIDIAGACVKLPSMVADEANDIRYGNYLRWRPCDVVEIGQLSPKQEVLRIYDPCLHGNLDQCISEWRSTDIHESHRHFETEG